MEMEPPKPLTFKVTRKPAELIPPAKPTPHEFKPLSDVDDQEGLRFQISVIQFYRNNPSMEGKDPVKVIRDAIAKALVFYYPFAGRLREHAARKLVVECTGEGVMFIEADADVTLLEFGDTLLPPFPCVEELLYDVPGSAGILNCPLLLIQVTRLKCGGFIFALRLNHTMSDAVGIVQFMSVVTELARGSEAPSITPVWERQLLSARDPPRITCMHPDYDSVPVTKVTLIPHEDMVHRSFFFGAAEIAALRNHLPLHLRRCSKYELLTACLWRCRTLAISPEPNEEVRMLCVSNPRNRFNPPLPEGYYGNVIAYRVVIATFEELSKNPLHYAVDLVRKTKFDITEEYMKSLADMMVIRDRPHYSIVGSYVVSDLAHAGFKKLDFGWGKAAYGGTTEGGVPGILSFYIPFKNNKGEDGTVIQVSLPENAMKVFVEEFEKLLQGDDDTMAARKMSVFIKSTL